MKYIVIWFAVNGYLSGIESENGIDKFGVYPKISMTYSVSHFNEISREQKFKLFSSLDSANKFIEEAKLSGIKEIELKELTTKNK